MNEHVEFAEHEARFWENRYRVQHKKLHKLEDALAAERQHREWLEEALREIEERTISPVIARIARAALDPVERTAAVEAIEHHECWYCDCSVVFGDPGMVVCAGPVAPSFRRSAIAARRSGPLSDVTDPAGSARRRSSTDTHDAGKVGCGVTIKDGGPVVLREVIFDALDRLDSKDDGLTPWQATLGALDALSQHGYRVVPADSTVLTAEEAKLAATAIADVWRVQPFSDPSPNAATRLYAKLHGEALSSQHTESDS